MKKIIVYLVFGTLGLSTVLNCIYLLGMAGEIWFRFGYMMFMFCIMGLCISNLIDKRRNKPLNVMYVNSKAGKVILVLSILLLLIWLVTCFMAISRL